MHQHKAPASVSIAREWGNGSCVDVLELNHTIIFIQMETEGKLKSLLCLWIHTEQRRGNQAQVNYPNGLCSTNLQVLHRADGKFILPQVHAPGINLTFPNLFYFLRHFSTNCHFTFLFIYCHNVVTISEEGLRYGNDFLIDGLVDSPRLQVSIHIHAEHPSSINGSPGT